MNKPVQYDDKLHAYSCEGIRYTSASQLPEKFTNPFPKDAHIAYAAKHGMTPEYWLNQWATKNEKSKIRGNNIHDYNEEITHARQIVQFEDVILPVHVREEVLEMPWIDRPDGVYTEQMTWHHGFKIAGRMDKVLLTTQKIKDNRSERPIKHLRYAHIEDYKTNERIDFESYQFKNGSHKMMKPPVGHLQDCNWIHYCIQQSAYMLMMEYQGFLPGSITITHYPHPTADSPNPLPVKYSVPYMKKEVISMCNFINR